MHFLNQKLELSVDIVLITIYRARDEINLTVVVYLKHQSCIVVQMFSVSEVLSEKSEVCELSGMSL